MKKLVFLSILLIALSFLGAADGEFHAGDQSVFILPTAYTMPKDSYAVTLYEALIPQFAYAATDRLHLSAAGTVIPALEEGEWWAIVSFGVKYNYFRAKNVESAVLGNYTHYLKTVTLGNVVSFGSNSGKGVGSVHLVGFLLGNKDNRESWELMGTLGMGWILRLSNRINAMAELTFVPFDIEKELSHSSEEENKYALLIAGFRYKWKRVALDLGAMHTLGGMGQSEFMRLPFVKVSILFR